MKNSRASRLKPLIGAATRYVAAAGLLATAFGIQADVVITQVKSFNLASGSLASSVVNDGTGPAVTSFAPAGSAPQTLTFSQFNSGLGTLTGVTFFFGSSFSSSVQLDVTPTGNGIVDDTVDYFADAKVTRLLTGIPDLIDQSSSDVLQATCHPGSGATGGCQDTDSSTGLFNKASTSLTPFAPFIGAGTFDITALLDWSELSLSVAPDNGTGYADNTTISGTLGATWVGDVTVEYSYAPATSVPEPGSLYLVGAALAAAGWLRRRNV